MTKTALRQSYNSRVRAWNAAHPKKNGKTARLSASEKIEAVQTYRAGADIGVKRRIICKALGVSYSSLYTWGHLDVISKSIERANPVPMPPNASPVYNFPTKARVPACPAASTVELTLANGTKVTGITAAEAVSLLKELA
jgi:hypothetical protein